MHVECWATGQMYSESYKTVHIHTHRPQSNCANSLLKIESGALWDSDICKSVLHIEKHHIESVLIEKIRPPTPHTHTQPHRHIGKHREKHRFRTNLNRCWMQTNNINIFHSPVKNRLSITFSLCSAHSRIIFWKLFFALEHHHPPYTVPEQSNSNNIKNYSNGLAYPM